MYKIYRLKQNARLVPLSGDNGGNINPKDPYVKRSELRAELKALEDRIKDEFNAKFDEVNARILKIETTLQLILNKLDTK